MLSFLRRIFFFLVFIVVVAFIFRNTLLVRGLGYAIDNRSGFSFHAESCDFSTFIPPIIFGSNLLLENPEDFQISNALDISHVEIRLPKDFWQKLDRPRIEKLSLAITEFSVVRNDTGKVNVMVIDELAKTHPGKIRAYPLITDLEISIDKVSFYDSFGLSPSVRPTPTTVQVDIKNLHLTNVQNLGQLERLIIHEALKKTKFKGLESEYMALGLQ